MPSAVTPETFLNQHCQRLHITAREYRPDIDGLRAVAILAVVIFHAFPNAMPGGFVGVDVFFVISGYLISQHIFASLNQGHFSYRDFYSRRIKRIFPALLFMLTACIGIGWLLLTPVEYKMLGRLLMGGASFAANFVLWSQAGYFDTAADTKPLLHLWSLAIEEQFYIVWPLLLKAIQRFRRPIIVGILLTVSLLSLLYSVYLVNIDAVADFYSPFTRFWELSLGALLALQRAPLQSLITTPIRQLSAWSGLSLLVLAVVALDSSALFPGLHALWPTLGAAGLIMGGMGQDMAWLNRRILASRIMVWIGLISYPLYLWHWPLLSFARIAQSGLPDPSIRLQLLGLSVLLAWFSYRWIELPVRSSQGRIARRWVYGLSAGLVIMFLSGWLLRSQDGFKFRALAQLDGDLSSMALGADRDRLYNQCGLPIAANDLKWEFCKTNSLQASNYAVLGDSKAEALFYGLAREIQFANGVLIGSILPPDPDQTATHPSEKEQLAHASVLHNPAIKVVIYVKALRTLFKIDDETGFIKAAGIHKVDDLLARYSTAIKQLHQAGKRVIFVVDNPTLPDPLSCVSGGMTSNALLNRIFIRKPNARCHLDYRQHLQGTQDYRAFIQSLQALHPELVVYDPTPLLCDLTHNVCPIKTSNGQYLYSYSDHISDYANSLIARHISPLLQDLLQPSP